MLPEKQNQSEPDEMPSAEYGNASNPSPQNDAMQPAGPDQLLDKKAETYLREVANIEDVPDAEEQQQAEDEMSNKD